MTTGSVRLGCVILESFGEGFVAVVECLCVVGSVLSVVFALNGLFASVVDPWVR